MKAKDLKVKYMRTDTGCLQVFVLRNEKLIVSLTVFPDNVTWLDIEHKSAAHIFPENALHRVWYKEVCRACGWESKPFEGVPVGPGGTLNCPECQKAKRNPWLEGCYGDVDAVALDWETKKPLEEKK